MITLAVLESRKKELEQRFAQFEPKKQELLKQAKDIEMEQVRMQGEFRLINEQIEELKQGEKDTEGPETKTEEPETPETSVETVEATAEEPAQ